MIINALKWLTNFLETRFPERVVPASKAALEALELRFLGTLPQAEADKAEIEKLKKQIELLNLRVGLSRPIQTVLRSNKNG